jgi:hypothetical protein
VYSFPPDNAKTGAWGGTFAGTGQKAKLLAMAVTVLCVGKFDLDIPHVSARSTALSQTDAMVLALDACKEEEQPSPEVIANVFGVSPSLCIYSRAAERALKSGNEARARSLISEALERGRRCRPMSLTAHQYLALLRLAVAMDDADLSARITRRLYRSHLFGSRDAAAGALATAAVMLQELSGDDNPVRRALAFSAPGPSR